MELIDVDGTAPPGSAVGPVLTSDGTLIRTARWPRPTPAPPSATPGTVVVMTGRTEFIEKYFEVIGELQARGFTVAAFDWRGQGLSDRGLKNPRKGHVSHFADYREDLAAVTRHVLEPFCPKPWFALAHSMGGAVALQAAARSSALFKRMVLSAPMIEIARVPATLKPAVRWFRIAGFGSVFVPAGPARSVLYDHFENNVLTSDPDRYARVSALIRTEPRLGIGAPTIGWLHAAFEAMAELHEEEFAHAFVTPTLIVMPGSDRVVDPRAAERLAQRLRACEILTIPQSRHEILMERDVFRQQFWAAFDAFIPEALPAHSPAP